jgi:hypothetical protein
VGGIDVEAYLARLHHLEGVTEDAWLSAWSVGIFCRSFLIRRRVVNCSTPGSRGLRIC